MELIEHEQKENEPFSKNLRRLETNDHYLTLALWKTQYGETFEIGIRCKATGLFKLMQGWDYYTSCSFAIDMVKVLLESKFTVEQIEQHLRP